MRDQHKTIYRVGWTILLVGLFPLDAWAYLDPGTGSMLLSVLVGLVSSAYFLLRRLPALTRAFFFRLAGKKDDLKGNGIVFYSEGLLVDLSPCVARLSEAPRVGDVFNE